MKNIGFIGVGTMGLPMALNLVKKGHTLSFFDPYANNETIFALTDVGAKQDNNIADLCDGKDFVISMLPIGKNVKDVALGEDGIINQEVNHLSSQDQFELHDGVGEAICQINAAGILAVIVTNQPVIARGELEESELKVIHNKMDTLLGRQGAYIDRLYYCPHHTDSGFDGEIEALKFDCNCRKPMPGMFIKAKNKHNIEFEKSWMIGDSERDIKAANLAGIKNTILIKTQNRMDKEHSHASYLVDSIEQTRDIILF